MKYIKRLLGLLPFLLLNVIGMFFQLFILGYAFMKYGGEACAYVSGDSPKTIADIYTLLEKQHKSE